jgi:AcrR family transcriptional regulator
VALLEDGGYEAFTIAAVCERAQVPPRALYARVDSKDALFLAVYEHGITRIRADHAVFVDDVRWRGLSADELVVQAVRAVAAIFRRHAGFLRAVVLISGVHPEVYRRGERYSRELGDAFTALVLRGTVRVSQPDPEGAVRAAFTIVFSAMVLRTAYGPGFATPAAGDDAFLDALTEMVRRYLLSS